MTRPWASNAELKRDRSAARLKLFGEVMEALPNGRFVLLVRETIYEFQRPRHCIGPLAIGHRAFVTGNVEHVPGARRLLLHATSVQAFRENHDESRRRWFAAWKASGGPRRAVPLERWSRALVIGTDTALDDVESWFERCAVEAEWTCVSALAKPQAVADALKEHLPKVRPDVVVLVRGGGHGVHHVYDDLRVVEAIAQLQETIPV
jgi:hypothetical protein